MEQTTRGQGVVHRFPAQRERRLSRDCAQRCGRPPARQGQRVAVLLCTEAGDMGVASMSSRHSGRCGTCRPPPTGQGVTQAMEDIYTFAHVLAVCGRQEVTAIASALKTWHHHRTRTDRSTAGAQCPDHCAAYA